MEVCVDNNYYENEFCGKVIPLIEFDKYAKQAVSKINYFTFRRITEGDINNNIKDTVCIIAELLFEQNKLKLQLLNQDSNNSQIASETLGPRSITYVNNLQYQDKYIKSDKELNTTIYQICKENIDDKFLYRGI